MKKILVILLLAACLALAGCERAENTAAEVHVFDCYDRIVSEEGQLILEPAPGEHLQIISDAQGRQTCLAAINQDFTHFTLYDLQGGLLGVLQAAGKVDYYALAAGGDYQKSLLVRNLFPEEQKYQVIGLDNQLLAEKDFSLPEGCSEAEFALCPADGFFAVQCRFKQNDSRYIGRLDFYDWQGQEFEIPGAYQDISNLGYYTDMLDWQEYHNSPYFRLWRPDAQGGYEDFCAVLDTQGHLLFETRSSGDVSYWGGERFLVWQDNREVMLDAQGRQIYPSPAEVPAAALPETMLYDVADYNSGQRAVINSAGEVVLPLPGNDFAEILTHRDGRQLYLLHGQGSGYEKRQNTTGQYLPLDLVYTFYDLQMQELLRTEFDNREVNGLIWPAYTPDYDLQKTLFLANKLQACGRYEIYDVSGRLLTSKQLFAPGEWGDCNVFLELSDKFVLVNYVLNSKEPNADGWYYFEQHQDVYLPDGTAVELPQPYSAVSLLRDKASSTVIGYIGVTASGDKDLLDENLQLVGRYKSLDYSAWNGMLIAAQADKRGIINMRGEWLYQESGFPESDN